MRAIAAALGAAAVLFAALAWRLSQGPVSLAYLTPYLSEGLSFAEAGFSAEIEDTILTWAGWDRTLDVRAVNVRVRDRAGRLVASMPEVSLGLSARALVQGKLAPTRADASGIAIKLVRNADGRLDLDFGTPDAAEPALNGDVFFAALVQALAKPSEALGPLAQLNRISILGTDITVYDHMTGSVWGAPRSDLVLQREPGGVRADLASSVDLGERTTRISAEAHYEEAQREVTLELRFDQLEPALLAHKIAQLKPLAALRVPFAGSVAFRVDLAQRRISDIGFDLAGARGAVELPEFYAKPIPVTQVQLRGTTVDDFRAIYLDDAFLDLEGFELQTRGVMTLAPGLGAEIEATLRKLPVNRLGELWPAGMAQNARDWVVRNVRDGVVPEGKLKVKLAPGAADAGKLAADAVQLDFSFEGVGADYFRPLPRLTRAKGQARLTAERFDLQVSEARVGELAVSDGRVGISGLQAKDQFATISLVVTGASAEALALLDHKPLGFPSRLGIKPATVTGQSATRARFIFPLENKLTIDQVDVAAAANLTDAGMPGVFDRFDMSQGALALKVDRKGLDAQGTVALNGVPMTVAWREEFDSRAPVTARYRLSGTVDAAGRKALGFPTTPYIDGPVGAEVAITSLPKGNVQLEGRFDLDAATMQADLFDWKKAAGVAGKLKLNARFEPKQATRIEGIELAAGDLKARGRAAVDADGLLSVEVPELAFGDNRLAVTVRRHGDGGYAVAAEGARLDLRRHIREAFEDSGSGEDQRPPLRIDAKLAEAPISDDVTLRQLDAQLEIAGGKLRQMRAGGGLPEGGAVQLSVQPTGARRKVALTSDNAAAVLRFLDIGHVQGGKLTMEAEIADDEPGAPTRGRAQMDGFKVVKAPLLARLLTIGSLTGIGELLGGEGISFVRAEVPFSMTGSVLTLKRARAYGASLGLTGEGTYDRKKDEINLTGTIVPSYTLNTIVNYLPLIGKLLTGGEGEGLVGINYRLVGPGGDPQVTVNPLSVLAPGVLRRLFVAPDASPDGDGLVGDPAARPDPAQPQPPKKQPQ